MIRILSKIGMCAERLLMILAFNPMEWGCKLRERIVLNV